MKVALDATYSVGNEPSGVAVYSRELLAGLAAAHPEVRFDFRYRPHRYLRSRALHLPPNASRRILHEPFFLPAADLFHGLNQRLPRVRMSRAVTTFHDLFVLSGDYSTPEFRHRFAEQARHAAAFSDAIIAVSEFTAGQVEQLLRVERQRLYVVHHGVRALPALSSPREPVILSVGALQRRKNMERLVQAFRAVPAPWRLVLAGSRGFGYEEILRAVEASPSRARIEMPGYIPDRVLAQWYARASIFAFPSLDEGFGMPVLEAMASGLPVLASNCSALPEVCGDAALLVDPQDADAIAAGLEMLIRSDSLRWELAQRGRQRAASFTWKKAVEDTWAVYQKLL